MRIFFDASVIIASLLSSAGGSSKLLEYVKAGRFVGITSQTALEEVLDKTEKIKKSKTEIENFITKSGLLVRENITFKEITPYKDSIDAKDAHLIAGANLTKSSHLVTLDKKHLLRKDIQKEFLPLQIVSPKDLLEKIASRE